MAVSCLNVLSAPHAESRFNPPIGGPNYGCPLGYWLWFSFGAFNQGWPRTGYAGANTLIARLSAEKCSAGCMYRNLLRLQAGAA